MSRLVVLSPCCMLESPGDSKYVDAWALPQTDLISISCGVAPGDSIFSQVENHWCRTIYILLAWISGC